MAQPLHKLRCAQIKGRQDINECLPVYCGIRTLVRCCHTNSALLCTQVGGTDGREAQAKAEKKAQKKAEARKTRAGGEEDGKDRALQIKEGTKEERQTARCLARRRERRPRTQVCLSVPTCTMVVICVQSVLTC